jgi:hypothetical protein
MQPISQKIVMQIPLCLSAPHVYQPGTSSKWWQSDKGREKWQCDTVNYKVYKQWKKLKQEV